MDPASCKLGSSNYYSFENIRNTNKFYNWATRWYCIIKRKQTFDMIENPLLLSLIQTVEIFYPFNNSSKSTISWCEGWRSWGVVTSVSTECSVSVPEVWCFFLTWELSLSLLENVELHWEQLWTTPEWVVWCRERCFLFLKHFWHWEHENSATFFSSSSSSLQSPRGSSFSSRVFFSWFSTLFSTW